MDWVYHPMMGTAWDPVRGRFNRKDSSDLDISPKSAKVAPKERAQQKMRFQQLLRRRTMLVKFWSRNRPDHPVTDTLLKLDREILAAREVLGGSTAPLAKFLASSKSKLVNTDISFGKQSNLGQRTMTSAPKNEDSSSSRITAYFRDVQAGKIHMLTQEETIAAAVEAQAYAQDISNQLKEIFKQLPT